jgi:hypothetical protein
MGIEAAEGEAARLSLYVCTNIYVFILITNPPLCRSSASASVGLCSAL